MSMTKRAIEDTWPDYFDLVREPEREGFEALARSPQDAAEFEAWLDSEQRNISTQDKGRNARKGQHMVIAREGGNSTPPVEEGTWTAVCVGVVDLGTQSENYEGDLKEARKVLIFWDIPDQRMNYKGEDKPRRISARYTVSLGEKANLRRVLEAWRGRKFTREELDGFDLNAVIGAPCMLCVMHKPKKSGGVFSSVQSVMALPKGMPRPAIETPILKYDTLDPATGDFIVPEESIPAWVRKIISESAEAKAASWEFVDMTNTAAPVSTSTVDDDVPF